MPKVEPNSAAMRRAQREMRAQIKSLSDAVGGFLLYMDSVMSGPANRERGEAIALACNRLDMAKQSAERYGLGIGLWRSKKTPTKS